MNEFEFGTMYYGKAAMMIFMDIKLTLSEDWDTGIEERTDELLAYAILKYKCCKGIIFFHWSKEPQVTNIKREIRHAIRRKKDTIPFQCPFCFREHRLKYKDKI